MLEGDSDDEMAQLRDAMVPEDTAGIHLLPLTVAEVAERGAIQPQVTPSRRTRVKRPASSSLPTGAPATRRQQQQLPHYISDDDTFTDSGSKDQDEGQQGRGGADKKVTNREAARQCRQRKKTKEEELKRERLALMSKHTELQYEVQRLSKELTQLLDVINDHACVLSP